MNASKISQKLDAEIYQSLEELALDLRASWNRRTDAIWRQLDDELWELTRNPWAVLQTVSKNKLNNVLADQKFSDLVSDHIQLRKTILSASTWFQENYSKTPLSCIAYFSMEFMLNEALPIYSGGLGNVAGDLLKAASDLGVPVVAIGLLYAQGYFRQVIDKNGEQQELYPYNDPGQLPIRPLRLANGEWLRLKIELPGWPLWLRTWKVEVGKSTLYLLDSNDMANLPVHRGITSELYGGNQELRLQQELVLGIGGWRLLHALGLEPEICHMNEGHAAFSILERAFCFMQKTKQPFEVAITATRAGNLFTTHTAAPAGFDRFSPELIATYLGKYARDSLGISFEKLLSLGQLHPNDDFHMAYLAIRGSGFVNGVSQLHGAISQHLFKNLFPRFPDQEIPIASVTNGVHMSTWESAMADDLWTEVCGKKRWLGKTDELEQKIRTIPDEKIWHMRNQARNSLLEHARIRFARQLGAVGASAATIEKAKSYLDPNTLTLGFARRFTAYKRPDLLLFDESRLLRLLNNQNGPIQLIIAGKAHPKDSEGHALIKKWIEFISKSDAHNSVIFLSDYDMILTAHLVQGVDVWINTPRRPWEACGTSGMKTLVNGGLNLSELDGWWAEAYAPEVGFALGDLKEHDDAQHWDRLEANALYDLLEQKVIPEFYARNAKNLPVAWIGKIRESMARLTPHFSANRMVREYTEKFYLPAAKNYRRRVENNGALTKQIVDWKLSLEQNWGKLRFGELKIKEKNGENLFEIAVYLNHLDRQAIKVELYSELLTKEMMYQGSIPNTRDGHIYRVTMPAEHPTFHFTPRIIPYFPNVAVPLESDQILWQK